MKPYASPQLEQHSQHRATRAADVRPGWIARRLAGIVGILAACAVGVADVALLYTPDGGYGSGSYEYLRLVPAWRLTLGHMLGVLVLPFEIAGLWQVSQALVPAGRTIALMFLSIGAYSVIMGTVYHAALAPLAVAVQARHSAPPDAHAVFADLIATMSDFAQPFSAITGYGVIALSVLFAVAVGFRPTLYPRWMLLCSPLTFVLLILLVAPLLPAVGMVLLPATFSIANAMFLALSTVIMWKAREG